MLIVSLQVAETDPEIEWVDQGWWGSPQSHNLTNCTEANVWCHCNRLPGSPTVSNIRFPENFTTIKRGNNGLTALQPDRVTLLQMQPAYRCSPGGPIFARRDGCPQPYPEYVSILEDGALGAHGGSGLSSFGGTLRIGELLPDAPPIRHALKLELFAHEYYYGGHDLNNKTAANGGRTQYVWPATGSDGYTRTFGSPLVYNGTNPRLAPGALLAIPPVTAANLMLQTKPGARLRDALTHFGGYLVDDTACDSAALCADSNVNAEFAQAYNFSFDTSDGPWYDDLVTIFQNLHIVANNGPRNTGGGGTPLAPLPPPFCE